jgi:adenosylcobinamide-phosphate synthase
MEWLQVFSLFSVSIVFAALVLDFYFAELQRFHPLVTFGNWSIAIEKRMNTKPVSPENSSEKTIRASLALIKRCIGLIAWAVAVLPMCYVSYLIEQYLVNNGSSNQAFYWVFAVLMLYLCIGWQSLLSHAKAIIDPLKKNDMQGARFATSMIVSRETAQLTEAQIGVAATESVLENGADAIFSAIFWFLLLGVPGVILYRLSNTLDAMWGYKNERYYYFGWAAARIDDVLNFIPARLTALSYMVLGNCAGAWQCWRKQGVNWKSPNAGPVMAAGAGALNVKLGGGSIYHGVYQERPLLGLSTAAIADRFAIQGACYLVDRVLALWIVVLLAIGYALC